MRVRDLPLAVLAVLTTGACSPWSIETAKFEFTGDREHDLCVCYRNGFAAGATKPPISATDYETAYTMCRSHISPPVDGGQAWTAGYSNGQAAAWSKRSCNSYLQTIGRDP